MGRREVDREASAPGTVIPSVTKYYQITAAGIDKIEGPGEFTRDRFQSIRIEATGQNIITLGDGNQVNVKFRDAGEALAELRKAVKESPQLEEAVKIDVVADIDSMQDQLAKAEPNETVVQTLWSTIKNVATVAGLAEAVSNLAPHIQGLLKYESNRSNLLYITHPLCTEGFELIPTGIGRGGSAYRNSQMHKDGLRCIRQADGYSRIPRLGEAPPEGNVGHLANSRSGGMGDVRT